MLMATQNEDSEHLLHRLSMLDIVYTTVIEIAIVEDDIWLALPPMSAPECRYCVHHWPVCCLCNSGQCDATAHLRTDVINL